MKSMGYRRVCGMFAACVALDARQARGKRGVSGGSRCGSLFKKPQSCVVNFDPTLSQPTVHLKPPTPSYSWRRSVYSASTQRLLSVYSASFPGVLGDGQSAAVACFALLDHITGCFRHAVAYGSFLLLLFVCHEFSLNKKPPRFELPGTERLGGCVNWSQLSGSH